MGSSSYCRPAFLEYSCCVKQGPKVHLDLGLSGFFKKKIEGVS